MNEACMFQAAEAVFREREPLEGVLNFLAARAKKAARELPESAEELFRGGSAAIEHIALALIEKRTAQDHEAAIQDLFPKYLIITLSLSRMARAIVSENSLDQMTRESICELEADFRDNAADVFGSAVKEQVLFTVWTLRKINDLLTSIHSTKVEDSKKEDDAELSQQFTTCSIYAQLNLDCLRVALQHNRAIYPEVMPRVMDGLRAMVNAYAFARRGLALRAPQKDEPLSAADQDEGDDALLDLSMRALSACGDD